MNLEKQLSTTTFQVSGSLKIIFYRYIIYPKIDFQNLVDDGRINSDCEVLQLDVSGKIKLQFQPPVSDDSLLSC